MSGEIFLLQILEIKSHTKVSDNKCKNLYIFSKSYTKEQGTIIDPQNKHLWYITTGLVPHFLIFYACRHISLAVFNPVKMQGCTCNLNCQPP